MNKTADLSKDNLKNGFLKKLKILSTDPQYKKIKITAIITAVIIIIAALLCWANLYQMIVPYDSSAITFEVEDGVLYANFSGGVISKSASTGVLNFGESRNEKNVAIICYYQTPWTRYIAPLYSDDAGGDSNSTYTISLGKEYQIDEVYYGKFSDSEVSENLEAAINKTERVWAEG